jgi:glycerol transport system permease protein
MTGANETTRVSETAVTEVGSTLSQDEVAKLMRRRGEESRWWWIVPTLYIVVLLLPIYWLINMSFKTNAEIVSSLTLYPHAPTLANYVTIFTDASWYSGSSTRSPMWS